MKIAGLFESSDTNTARLVFGWLLLAVLSLMFAGMFAILVVLARTPFIENMLPMGRDYIYVALVGHVDLAVVIWFLAFQGALLLLTGVVRSGKGVWSAGLGWASLALSCAGMLIVVFATALGLGRPELANYVPVLLTPVFYVGLAAFATGVFLALVNTGIRLISAVIDGERLGALTIGMVVCGLGVLIAFLCFGLSAYFQWSTGKATIDFERLFWGGGHILQAVNTASMAVAWALLARIIFNSDLASEKASKAVFAVYLAFMLPAPFIYLVHDTSSYAHKDSFTFLMRWGLGPSTVVFMVAAIWLIASRSKKERNWADPGLAALALSILCFIIGGVIGFNISGVNTKIPAHYHSNIGAVTIAFMGLFYKLLPSLGREVYFKRLSVAQPYLYAVGILLFVAGLYLAGAHGAARKAYSGAQELDNTWKMIGMAVMGLGGVVSIAGGAAFVVNALASLAHRKNAEPCADAQGCGRR